MRTMAGDYLPRLEAARILLAASFFLAHNLSSLYECNTHSDWSAMQLQTKKAAPLRLALLYALVGFRSGLCLPKTDAGLTRNLQPVNEPSAHQPERAN